MRLSAESTLGAPLGATGPVAGFTQSDAALVERADMACVLLTVAVENAETVAAASRAIGFELPTVAGPVRYSEQHIAVWLTPRSWLVLSDVVSEAELVSRVNAASRDGTLHASRFTDYLCWLELSGPHALDLLTRLSFVSLERGGLAVGSAKRTLVAGIPAVIVHKPGQVWWLGVERSRARYFVGRLLQLQE